LLPGVAMRFSLLTRAGGIGRWWRRIVLAILLVPLGLILLFRFVPVPLTPLMLVRTVQGYGWQHDWVPINRMAPALAHAVIASEDNLFCTETLGFDTAALQGQLAAWWHGQRPRGASTITQQTAKNVFLWPGRDVVRKAAEAAFTLPIALLWPKRRVLEVYLNSIEFGPGLYGVEAASMQYFRHHAADITATQAARLAVILPDPLHWSAAHPGPYVADRTQIILRRMGELGSLLDCAE
jgi:monofunctional biosynthetic peptidoglycan transglycosylase